MSISPSSAPRNAWYRPNFLQHRARPGRPVDGQSRRQVRAVGGPRGVHRLRRRPFGEVGEEATGERAGDPERARRDAGVELRESGDCGDAAEDAADRGRVEAARVECPGCSHPDAARDLVPGDDRREGVSPARAGRLGGGKGSRRDHGGHVADRVRVCVVEVEPVAEHRVGERGVRRRQTGLRADHGRLRHPSQLGHRRAALVRDAGRVRSEPAADRVEHVELRVDADGIRNAVEVDRRRPLGDGSRCGHRTVHSSSVLGNPSATSGAPRR